MGRYAVVLTWPEGDVIAFLVPIHEKERHWTHAYTTANIIRRCILKEKKHWEMQFM